MRVKFYDMNKQPIGCMNIIVPKLTRDFIQAVKEAGTEFGAGTDRCMSDYENSFEILDNTILYEKYTEETKISITINNSKVTKYFSKIISTIERLLDAIAYNIISSDDEEQVARMQEFIKRFNKFSKGE